MQTEPERGVELVTRSQREGTRDADVCHSLGSYANVPAPRCAKAASGAAVTMRGESVRMSRNKWGETGKRRDFAALSSSFPQFSLQDIGDGKES